MADTKKVTKKDMFNSLLAIETLSQEQRDFIAHEIELLDKKNASKKPSKEQKENETIKADVLALFTEDMAMTATDVLNALPSLKSTQKASAMLKLLVEDGKVVKATEKGKSLFRLA